MKPIKLLTYILLIVIPFFVIHAEDEVLPIDTIAPEISLTEEEPVILQTVKLSIRDGEDIIFSGDVTLDEEKNIDLTDKDGVLHSVDNRSILAVINKVAEESQNFSISDLEYYTSFDSLYIKCINNISKSVEQCDNWQFAVDNAYGSVGMDKSILSGGENIYVYFGQQYKISLSSKKVTTEDSLTVTSYKYDYQNNQWLDRDDVTIGITQNNPDDPWNPIEIKTEKVDQSGQATFTKIEPGTYNVGVKEDFYFPTEELIVEKISNQGGGGGGSINKKIFDLQGAVNFIISHQDNNGSFENNEMYTDWAGIALGSVTNQTEVKEKIISYFKSNYGISKNITDNERHAMALLSLNENPYSFNDKDFISPIVNAFDGAQFGDDSLINDDIFAIIVLEGSGYTIDDLIILKDLQYIISKQKADGSWEESVDMTAASIEALSQFRSLTYVSQSLDLASSYIKTTENVTGGWGSVYSTSWVLQSVGALGLSVNNNTIDYLANNQMQDSGLLDENESISNRIWATSYAILGSLEKPWPLVFHHVGKSTISKKVEETSNAIEPKVETIEKVNNDLTETPVEVNKSIIETKINKPKNTKNLASSNTVNLDKPEKSIGNTELANLPAAAISSNFHIDNVIALSSLLAFIVIILSYFIKL